MEEHPKLENTFLMISYKQVPKFETLAQTTVPSYNYTLNCSYYPQSTFYCIEHVPCTRVLPPSIAGPWAAVGVRNGVRLHRAVALRALLEKAQLPLALLDAPVVPSLE